MINRIIIVDLFRRTVIQIIKEKEREKDKSYQIPFREEESRDKKSLRFSISSLTPKISEILKPLAILKGSRSSEILERSKNL